MRIWLGLSILTYFLYLLKETLFLKTILRNNVNPLTARIFTVFGHTVKLANSASPFKFRKVKFSQKTSLENNEINFSQRETGCNWHCYWKTYFIILNKSLRLVFAGNTTGGISEFNSILLEDRVFTQKSMGHEAPRYPPQYPGP